MQRWDYSSLPQCGSSKRLQLWQQDLKSNDMAASEDGGVAAVAEALGRKRPLLGGGRKRLQQRHGRSTWMAAGKDCSGGAVEAGFEQRACLNVAGQ